VSRELYRRWFKEVWNERREASIDALLAPNSVAHGLGEPVHGPAGFRVFHKAMFDAFPKLQVEIHDTIEGPPEADGSVTVAGRFTAKVTDKNGRSGDLACMAFARFRRGQIVEAWNVVDFHGLGKQLGSLPF
jgi:predicted ester cyclase